MPKANKRKKEEKATKDDDSSSDSGPEDTEPAKKEAKPSNDGDSKGKKTGNKQEPRFELSKNKFVTVSTYKSHLQIDIREYYMNANGDLAPGKKGITLNPVQWEQLKGIMADVDAAILEHI